MTEKMIIDILVVVVKYFNEIMAWFKKQNYSQEDINMLVGNCIAECKRIDKQQALDEAVEMRKLLGE